MIHPDHIYLHQKNKVSKLGLNSLMELTDALSIPISLSEYLRYIIKRNRQEAQIRKIKVYNLYQMLSSYGYYLDSYETAYSIYVHNISLEIQEKIKTEIVSSYGVKSACIYQDNKVTSFNTIAEVYNDLQTIDKFYHPHVPRLRLFK